MSDNRVNKDGKYIPPDISPEEQQGLHKVLIGFAVFFFAWLVIEGLLLVPILFPRYGLH